MPVPTTDLGTKIETFWNDEIKLKFMTSFAKIDLNNLAMMLHTNFRGKKYIIMQ